MPKKQNRSDCQTPDHEMFLMAKTVRFLAAKERFERMKRKGVTLFPSLSNDNKSKILYIEDED